MRNCGGVAAGGGPGGGLGRSTGFGGSGVGGASELVVGEGGVERGAGVGGGDGGAGEPHAAVRARARSGARRRMGDEGGYTCAGGERSFVLALPPSSKDSKDGADLPAHRGGGAGAAGVGRDSIAGSQLSRSLQSPLVL